MRAICCAVLALVFYGMGAVMSNAGNDSKHAFVAGIHVFLSYIFIVVSVALCIAGL